jgi:sec-independent protein translocase protein TatA
METYIYTQAFIGGLGPWEIGVILVIALLIFGKRLPEVGKSLGKGIVEFKRGLHGVEDEIESAVHKTDTKEAPKEIKPPAESMDSSDSKETEVTGEQKVST